MGEKVLRKFERENSIYYMYWGAHTLGTFSPFVFTFRLVVFRFLWRKLYVRYATQVSNENNRARLKIGFRGIPLFSRINLHPWCAYFGN
jgi:hypothetical protein